MRERSGFYPLNNWDPSLFPSSRSNTGFLTPDETFVTFLFFFGRLSQYWTCNLGRIFSRLDSTISREKYFENILIMYPIIFGIIKKLNYIWTNNEIFISLRKISLLFSRAAPVFTSSFNYSYIVQDKKKKKICPISNNAILSSPPFSFPPSSSSFFFYLIEVGFLDFQETRNRKSNYQKERKENFHYETLFSSR